MHFSWATGGKWATIFIPGTLHYRSATFLFPFSRGNVLATTSCDRPGMRRTETSERSCFNASRAVWRRGRGSGYPHPSYMKALSFSIYWPATAAWNKTGFFFQEERIHDFISNLSLPLRASNWKQSHEEAASGGSWMLTRQNIQSLQVLTHHI